MDGALREYGVFEESGLVRMPGNLSFNEACTLSCAALTAWNALYGLNALKPGDWVLTEGTGGVSIFAIQFALAAGATVIATTSSDDKATRLKELGAQHVINYKKDTEWGKTAKNLSPGKLGVHHVIEVSYSFSSHSLSFTVCLTDISLPGWWANNNGSIVNSNQNRWYNNCDRLLGRR